MSKTLGSLFHMIDGMCKSVHGFAPTMQRQNSFSDINTISSKDYCEPSVSRLISLVLKDLEIWFFRHYGIIINIDTESALRIIEPGDGRHNHVVIKDDFPGKLSAYLLKKKTLAASIILTRVSNLEWKMSLDFRDSDETEYDHRLLSLMFVIQAALIRGGDTVTMHSSAIHYSMRFMTVYFSSQNNLINFQNSCMKMYPEFLKKTNLMDDDNDEIYNTYRSMVHHHHLLDVFEQAHINWWLHSFSSKMEFNSYSLWTQGKKISVLDVKIHCEVVYSVYISEIDLFDCDMVRGKGIYMTTQDHSHYSLCITPWEKMILMCVRLFLSIVSHVSEAQNINETEYVSSSSARFSPSLSQHSSSVFVNNRIILVMNNVLEYYRNNNNSNNGDCVEEMALLSNVTDECFLNSPYDESLDVTFLSEFCDYFIDMLVKRNM